VKRLSCVKFMNIYIKPTPQPNSGRLKEVSDDDEKYDNNRYFKMIARVCIQV